ncbi:hypothetical protein OKW29_000264 [Paraburkholderia sp. CI3]
MKKTFVFVALAVANFLIFNTQTAIAAGHHFAR